MARPSKLIQMRRVLRRARVEVAEQLAGILEAACVADEEETLMPRRETLDELAKPYVRRLERLISAIDRALR